VQLGRYTSSPQDLAEECDDAVGVEAILTQMPPAIDPAKHRSTGNAGHADPVQVGLYRTESFQCGRLIGSPKVLAIPLAVRQVQLHAGTSFGLDLLDLQATQLVTAKATPEADQDQGGIATAAQ